jgi:hypothetical protein
MSRNEVLLCAYAVGCGGAAFMALRASSILLAARRAGKSISRESRSRYLGQVLVFFAILGFAGPAALSLGWRWGIAGAIFSLLMCIAMVAWYIRSSRSSRELASIVWDASLLWVPGATRARPRRPWQRGSLAMRGIMILFLRVVE